MAVWIRLLLTFVVSYLVLACDAAGTDKRGSDYFKEGLRLSQDDGKLDEAAMNFFSAVLHVSSNDDMYDANDALSNFLLCYQRQNKLGLGYAFIAAQMYKMKDQRAIEYIREAHKLDPNNDDILRLMTEMGETPETLKITRRYKEETPKRKAESVDEVSAGPRTCNSVKACAVHFRSKPKRTLEFDPGWSDQTNRRYNLYKSRMRNTPPWKVTIPPLGTFEVGYDLFWRHFDGEETRWEPQTFAIFSKYVNSETVVIDFGTWIGPTLLYHAQISKKSVGFEVDPIAFATVESNVNLNPELAKKIILESVAVTTPKDAGITKMMGTSKAGNSEARLNVDLSGQTADSWEVEGYTLPYLMADLEISLTEQPVFVKIDIEGYECELIPSFFEWLFDESERQLTIFVSYHPQIEPCTKSEMMAALDVFKLFGTVSCGEGQSVLPIQESTTFDQFEAMLDENDCHTSKHNSDFVLTGVAGVSSPPMD